MIYRHILSVTLFLISSGMVYAGGEANYTESIQHKFQLHVAKSYENFRFCELFSKDEDKRRFIEKSLDKQLLEGSTHLKYKELLTREEAARSSLHLGVIALTYSSENQANRALKGIEPKGYLGNTKILTQYLIANKGNINLIIYSETFLEDIIKSFFAEF